MGDDLDEKRKTRELLLVFGIGTMFVILTSAVIVCMYATILLGLGDNSPSIWDGHESGMRDATGGIQGLSEGELHDDSDPGIEIPGYARPVNREKVLSGLSMA